MLLLVLTCTVNKYQCPHPHHEIFSLMILLFLNMKWTQRRIKEEEEKVEEEQKEEQRQVT
jgi:hypothetical protein